MENKIIVLILSTKSQVYGDFKHAIENTWLKDLESLDIKCYFYEGDAAENIISGNTIYLTCSDLLTSSSEKFRKALTILSEKEENISAVYRTNLSSYIDAEVFYDFLKDKKDLNKSYAGIIGEARVIPEYFYNNKYIKFILNLFKVGPKLKFCSGSGVFIGSDYFSKLIHTQKYDRYVDDIMIRLVLGFEPNEDMKVDRFNVIDDIDFQVSDCEYDYRIRNGLFHYRFKTQNRYIDSNLLRCFSDKYFRKKFCTRSE